MLGSSGSSAMELFRDQIMELEDKYMPDRRIIMDTTRVSFFCLLICSHLDLKSTHTPHFQNSCLISRENFEDCQLII